MNQVKEAIILSPGAIFSEKLGIPDGPLFLEIQKRVWFKIFCILGRTDFKICSSPSKVGCMSAFDPFAKYELDKTTRAVGRGYHGGILGLLSDDMIVGGKQAVGSSLERAIDSGLVLKTTYREAIQKILDMVGEVNFVLDEEVFTSIIIPSLLKYRDLLGKNGFLDESVFQVQDAQGEHKKDAVCLFPQNFTTPGKRLRDRIGEAISSGFGFFFPSPEPVLVPVPVKERY